MGIIKILIRRLVSPRTSRPQHMLPRKSRPAALPAYLALYILSRRLFEAFHPSKIYYCAFSDAFPVWQSQYIVRGNTAHFLCSSHKFCAGLRGFVRGATQRCARGGCSVVTRAGEQGVKKRKCSGRKTGNVVVEKTGNVMVFQSGNIVIPGTGQT